MLGGLLTQHMHCQSLSINFSAPTQVPCQAYVFQSRQRCKVSLLTWEVCVVVEGLPELVGSKSMPSNLVGKLGDRLLGGPATIQSYKFLPEVLDFVDVILPFFNRRCILKDTLCCDILCQMVGPAYLVHFVFALVTSVQYPKYESYMYLE